MTHPLRARIVAVLTAPESPLRDAGVALVVDGILDRRLRELVDLEEVHGIVISALTRENVERVVSRHVRPGFDRYGALVAESGETVGGLVPESAVEPIHAIVDKARPPRAKWAEGIVDPALVRRLFAPVWTHLLVNFAKKMPLPGVGGGGAASAAAGAAGRGISGVASRLSKSAEKLVDVSRNVMGGIGAELEKRIQSTAKDFGEGAQGMFRDALRDRLKSEEGRELVSQMRRQIVEHVHMTKLAALHEDAVHFPVDDVLAVAPDVIAHAVRRPFAQKLVSREIRAFLEKEGDRSLRDLLLELGLEESVRKLVAGRGSDLLRETAASPAFGAWLDELLGQG